MLKATRLTANINYQIADIKFQITDINALMKRNMTQMLETDPVVTRFEGIDKLILNPGKPKLITVISKPAGGKSAFLLSSAKELADSDVPVTFYSFDMSKDQAEKRLEKFREGVPEEASLTIIDCLDQDFDFFEERNISLIKEKGYKTLYVDGLWNVVNNDTKTLASRIKTLEMQKQLKKLVKDLQVSVIVSLDVKDFKINKDTGWFEISSTTLEDIEEPFLQFADALIFLDRPAFNNPEKRANPEIIEAYVFNNPEGFAGSEELSFDRKHIRLRELESADEANKKLLGEHVTTVFIVCLDGTDEALHHAYRSSIRMLAENSLEFGDEGEPQYLDFNWSFIDKFRVLTVKTNGAGIMHDFSRIPGITECLWIIYDDCSGWYESNDSEGKILSRKELFGIPKADYEVDGDAVSEVSGTIGWSPENPDILEIDAPEDLPF